MNDDPMDTAALQSLIRDAFADTVLGDGIGLWQAQAIDDYEPVARQLAARRRDEQRDWQAIPVRDLNRCTSSLSFFDAEGMRFHLPAFLIAAVDGVGDANVVFHLTCCPADPSRGFGAFSPAQRRAVRAFLQWCLSQEDYAYERPEIARALNAYWRA